MPAITGFGGDGDHSVFENSFSVGFTGLVSGEEREEVSLRDYWPRVLLATPVAPVSFLASI